MTTQSDFTSEEWMKLIYAPFLAGSLVMGSDVGILSIPKESAAILKGATDSKVAKQGVVAKLATGFARKAKKLDTPTLGKEENFQATLERIREAAKIMKAKATPEEFDSFKAWVMHTAQVTAEAAKEGKAFHKNVRVSDKEKAMMERIQQALGD
jgi:hypothetical protein